MEKEDKKHQAEIEVQEETFTEDDFNFDEDDDS